MWNDIVKDVLLVHLFLQEWVGVQGHTLA